jgi:hypothetical protein
MLVPIPPPAWSGQTLRFRTRPRAKRTFHTVLDAADMLTDRSVTTATLARTGASSYALRLVQELRRGTIDETTTYDDAFTLRRLERRVSRPDGAESRQETVDFAADTHPLPACTYVDVSAPFVLGAQPFDGKSRALYAWICDRFVAKVYYESRGITSLTVPAGRFDVHEVVMYPDLNDWVKLPGIITKLSKPFIPKYHMFYEAAPPHRPIVFEGPHGPPGAPEVVLELESHAGA